MDDLPPALATLAADRDGVITRAEMLAAGLSEDAVRWRSTRWCTVLPGVYCVDRRESAPGAGVSFEVRVWAGLLFAGEGACVGGLAAAYLWGLVDEAPSVVEIVVRRSSRLRSRPGWLFRRRRADVVRPPRPSARPRLQVEDVVLDLCAEAPDAASSLTPVMRACQRGLTTPGRIAATLALRKRHPRRELVGQVLADVEAGATTHLELRYRRDVERAHGLPSGVGQLRVPGTGRLVDRGYPEQRVLVELDGRMGHVAEGRFRDMARDNAHLVLEWVTLRYGWAAVVHDPCAVAAEVARVLRARGWEGSLTPCPRCAR